MLSLKPFIRITFLSIILMSLLIYLGVKYHWGNQFKALEEQSLELKIPNKVVNENDDDKINKIKDSFDLKIINNNPGSTLVSSMNKEQIAEQCINLLSRDINDAMTLELATVNCVASNYQETFQTQNIKNLSELQNKKSAFSEQCKRQFNTDTQYTVLEKQLLIGICISDKLNTN